MGLIFIFYTPVKDIFPIFLFWKIFPLFLLILGKVSIIMFDELGVCLVSIFYGFLVLFFGSKIHRLKIHCIPSVQGDLSQGAGAGI